MTDLQAIADRVEIEALRGEFTDAAMMRDRARLASLFTPYGALRMPNIPAELVGRDQIRAGASGCRAPGPGTRRRRRISSTARSRCMSSSRHSRGQRAVRKRLRPVG
jgi:hypothetical protein